MAIYGAGSLWSNEEVKERFFRERKMIIGWDEGHSKDLYELVSHLKVGDIIYLKSVSPRWIRTINVKGIGIVTRSFMQCLQAGGYENTNIADWNGLFVNVNWVQQSGFKITIPENDGKLTNVRPATFYEEHLAFVQHQIVDKLTNALNIQHASFTQEK